MPDCGVLGAVLEPAPELGVGNMEENETQRWEPAPEVVEAAGRQGAFWELHDAIYDGGGHFARDAIVRRALACRVGSKS